ncbi:cytochrome C biogenesis protein [Jeotgalibacillus sp. R-1-5s-1]|uniref:cytochrome C biogenesis protein n=1 Tax=Jeotgalibacillus sp. R-1-5s-1 TaxID=2555897 RepID=UPI00106B6A52|nr:cytochrome C biogenesis protein [Jeotgalibacillus sp. R-1-5s-1]TFD94511.1 cytochrome C biogenesis protein [Jeotgalibacillus sp. R-1-5s-1]
MRFSFVKIEVLLPEDIIIPLRNRLNDAGILHVGHYDHVLSYTHTKGYWRPLNTAKPFNGNQNEISFGEECKMEFRCPIDKLALAKQIVKDIHPYEEAVMYIIPLLD